MRTTKREAANEVDMLRETNVGSAGSGMKTSNLETFAGYQQLVDALGDAVIICDRGVIRLWNAAAERLFGFTRLRRSEARSISSFRTVCESVTGPGSHKPSPPRKPDTNTTYSD